MKQTTTGRRTFLTTCALAGAAAARPFAAFGQAVDSARQASAPSALRITDVKCGYIRGSLFVKIHTNQGIWGCGEAVDAVQGTYHLVQSLGQRLRNQSPLNVHESPERPDAGRLAKRRFDRGLTQLHAQVRRRRHGRRRCRLPADQFHERHQRHGIHEMHAEHPVRPPRRRTERRDGD